jgi:hypothetical protein
LRAPKVQLNVRSDVIETRFFGVLHICSAPCVLRVRVPVSVSGCVMHLLFLRSRLDRHPWDRHSLAVSPLPAPALSSPSTPQALSVHTQQEVLVSSCFNKKLSAGRKVNLPAHPSTPQPPTLLLNCCMGSCDHSILPHHCPPPGRVGFSGRGREEIFAHRCAFITTSTARFPLRVSSARCARDDDPRSHAMVRIEIAHACRGGTPVSKDWLIAPPAPPCLSAHQ